MKLFNPSSRSLNLTFSLTIAVAIFLAPIVMLLALLLQEQQKAIDFAKQEMRGVQMTKAITKTELSLTEALYQTTIGSPLTPQLVASAASLQNAQSSFAKTFKTEAAVQAISKELLEIAKNGRADSEKVHALRAELRVLTTQVGDASNLILDPELDSYYLMDLLIVRFPELGSILSAKSGAFVQGQKAKSFSLLMGREDLLRLEGGYSVAVRQLEDSFASSLRHAQNPERLGIFQSEFSEARRALSRLDTYSRQATQDVVPFDPSVAMTLEWQTRQHMHKVTEIVADELMNLLANRIKRLEESRRNSLLTSFGLFAVAMALVFGLLRNRVTKPLMTLTRVAEKFNRGDLSEPTPLEGRDDEIGALARAFELLRTEALGRVEAEAERASAVAANLAKSSFLAMISHELRTPLNAVIGYAEILEEDMRQAEMQQSIKDATRINTAGRHLLGIINEILDLSKIEVGALEIEKIDYSPIGILQEVADTISPMLQANGNVLAFDGEPITKALGDPTRLRQCLLNLASNAAKFTQNGFVSLTMRQRGPFLVFTVKDTGIGLSQAQLDRIFEPFVQADGSTTRKFGGTGLGLAITRNLARLLGGDVTVTSQLGEGSVFELSIAHNRDEVAGAVFPDLEQPLPNQMNSAA